MEKKQLRFSHIDLMSYNPMLAEEGPVRGHDYISWGAGNDYPQYLYEIYCNCATLQSIVNGSIDFTMGNGIVNNTPFKGRNQKGDTLEDVIHKAVTDRWIFGGTNIQVLFNAMGKTNEVIWLDSRYCRTDAKCRNVYYSKKWGGDGVKTGV